MEWNGRRDERGEDVERRSLELSLCNIGRMGVYSTSHGEDEGGGKRERKRRNLGRL